MAGPSRDADIQNIKDVLDRRIDEIFDRVPDDLPLEDKQEWLRDTLLDAVYDTM